jgi:putative ABC transport system permease protein
VSDFRFALRMLRKSPGFALIAIMVLALGIGANTAIFSIVNAALLRPLPFPNPEQLYTVSERNTNLISPIHFNELRERGIFDQMAAADVPAFNVRIGDRITREFGARVTPNFFELLGINLTQGRGFRQDEEAHVAILNYAFWQNSLGSDPGILGKAIILNGEPFTVVGVLPATFRFPLRFDIFTPLLNSEGRIWSTPRPILYGFARVGPGRSAPNPGADIRVTGLREQMVSSFRPALLVFQSVVALVLLIACANVANLLLARASARRREMAIRVSLGATGWRLARQMMTESLVLAVLAAAGGILIAVWGLDSLVATLPTGVTFEDWMIDPRDVGIDAIALAFTLACTLATALLFGLAPALEARRTSLAESAKRGRTRLRGALVAAEVALALVLMTGAAVLGQTFVHLLESDPGYQPNHLLRARYARNTQAGHQQFAEQLLERVRALPGVESVALTNGLPLTAFGATFSFTVEGRPIPPEERRPETDTRIVTAGYLTTMQTPLLRGRWFTDADRETSPGVVVISDSFARRWFAGEDPLGKRLRVRYRSLYFVVEIVGIAGNIRYTALEPEPMPVLYGFWRQMHWRELEMREIAIRARAETAPLVEALRQEVAALDKDAPLYIVNTMDRVLGASLGRPRFSMWLVGIFALVALILAALGLYGVLSYLVGARTREIGVRMALGADRARVLHMVVREGLALTAAGVFIGILASAAAIRALSALLYGAKPDLTAFAAAAVALFAVAACASLIPARRATRISPIEALRHE